MSEHMDGPATKRHSEPAADPDSARVMAMLSEHVPLSLLVDLVVPGGPDSRRLLDEEGLPDDAWWDQPASG